MAKGRWSRKKRSLRDATCAVAIPATFRFHDSFPFELGD
jgi:hypothetical protein